MLAGHRFATSDAATLATSSPGRLAQAPSRDRRGAVRRRAVKGGGLSTLDLLDSYDEAMAALGTSATGWT